MCQPPADARYMARGMTGPIYDAFDIKGVGAEWCGPRRDPRPERDYIPSNTPSVVDAIQKLTDAANDPRAPGTYDLAAEAFENTMRLVHPSRNFDIHAVDTMRLMYSLWYELHQKLHGREQVIRAGEGVMPPPPAVELVRRCSAGAAAAAPNGADSSITGEVHEGSTARRRWQL